MKQKKFYLPFCNRSMLDEGTFPSSLDFRLTETEPVGTSSTVVETVGSQGTLKRTDKFWLDSSKSFFFLPVRNGLKR